MRKYVIALSIIACLIIIGCTQKYRIHSAALLDRSPQEDYGMTEIEDTLRSHAVNIVDEDSLLMLLGKKELVLRSSLLCAAYRQDRLKSAVALGKEVGVDAVIYSSMPPVGMKNQMTPCLSESLISFFIVEPPMVLFEANNYFDFIYNMSSINWEVVVSEPPEPEEFTLSLGGEISYAGLRLSIARNEGEEKSETGKDDASGNETGSFQGQADSETDISQTDDETNLQKQEAEQKPWLFVVEEDYHKIYTEAFEQRIVGKITGKLHYDISAVDIPEEPRFRLILTDLRIE